MITYDEKFAKARGINVTFYQFLISFLTALIVVLGMRMMGTLLISSLIVFPAIIAKGLTGSFKELIIISGIFNVLIKFDDVHNSLISTFNSYDNNTDE